MRQRYNDLEAERQTLLAATAGLDQQEAQEPDRSGADQIDLLEAFPHLAINLHRVPDELLGRLFDLTQLTVRVHYDTDEATVKVILPADDVAVVAEIGEPMEEEMVTQTATCSKTAGGNLCASCTCPRCDSNAHWTAFETVASADWATGARCGNSTGQPVTLRKRVTGQPQVGDVTHVVNAIWLTGSFPVGFWFAGNRVSHPLEPSGGPR